MSLDRKRGVKRERTLKPRRAASDSVKGAVKKSKGDSSSGAIYPRSMRFLRFCFFIGFSGFVFYFVNWKELYSKFQSLVNKPVANIVVKGEFTYLSQKNIQKMVMDQISSNFVDVNLVDLQLRLQIEPWVKSASVQRSWPDGLLIEVNEEKPIARWADDAFISNEGAVIVIDENVSLSHLPRLAGPLNESLAITRTYLEMTELFASRKLVLTGVNVDETMAWSISLKNGIEIVFGQYDVLTKLRNFLLVYDTNLQPDIGRVKRVDMRYESGMAVAWRLD